MTDLLAARQYCYALVLRGLLRAMGRRIPFCASVCAHSAP